MKPYFYTAVLIITILLPLSTHANTFCVSDATGLQTALTTASSNGEDDTVQIEQGTYVGSFIYTSTEAFSLTVEGGYTSSCSSKVVDPNNTVLDANNNGPVLVLSAPGFDADFVVDGLTIQNGNVIGNDGGGLHTRTSNGNIIITNNTVTNNHTDGEGGGVYVSSFGPITFTNNTITGNSAQHDTGGGIRVKESSGPVTFTNNTITDNSAQYLGGIYVSSSNGPISFTNNTIADNSAQYGGGGVDITSSSDPITFINNIITGNSVQYGSQYFGGVRILNTNARVTFINNTITGNTSVGAGGVYISSPSTSSTLITLINNTITGNSAQYGGGLYVSLGHNSDEVNITNNIIWGNTTTDSGNDLYIDNDGNGDYFPSTVNLYNNDFDQSADGTYIQIPFSIDPSNLDNEDPLFVDAPNDDYHLTDLSPCIDVGSLVEAPPDDMDGHSRPQGDGVDIGADEYIPPDADEDGVPNDEDNCPTDANPDQTDTDHDCIGDVCDDFPNDYDPTVTDSDGDGVGNDCDVCPYDFDDDIDADGLCANEDNCPDIPNGPDLGSCINILTGVVGTTCLNDGECNTGETCSNDQEDRNNNGSGDACDIGTFCRGLADYDQDVDAADVTVFLSHFGRSPFNNPCPQDGPAPPPKTGQTTSYAAYDDGYYQMGVDRPLPKPRFSDNGNGTVSDNLTGLIWLKNANCFEMQDWNPAIIVCSGLASGSCGLTDGSNAGDWRLANAKELASLVDFNNNTPALPSGHPFENVQSHDYWSSTTRSYNTGDAWYVHMGHGNLYDANKISNGYVWCVRGGH